MIFPETGSIVIANYFHVPPNGFWQFLSVLLSSHPTIKWGWKNYYVAISLMLNYKLNGLNYIDENILFLNLML